MNYFVTAIGTDSGKTLTSAIFCQALMADYWKPVQAGFPRDSDTVRNLVSNKKTFIHEESYLFQTAASPHAAAKIENIQIDLEKFPLPATDNHLIIEGAGGCLVPLNDQYFVIDLIKKTGAGVVLVSDLYLGSINHTMLTIEALNNRQIQLHGIVFNGDGNEETERIIMLHARAPKLIHIQQEKIITPDVVKKYATVLKENWNAGPF